MSRRRQERMAGEIKRILSHILQEEIKDPRIDFAALSITRVDVSNDLSHARINISVLGDEAKQAASMKALEKAKGYIRLELGRSIQVKHAPELEFRLDKSIEHGFKITNLLKELEEEEAGKDL